MARLRLVVADDDRKFLRKLVSLLEVEFDVVATATDGKSALDRIRRTSPDVAVLDLYMPGGNGIEVTRELIKRRKHPPVVICSKETDPEIIEAAVQAGAMAFVSKVRVEEDLASAVQSAHRGESFVRGESSSVRMNGARFFKILGQRVRELRRKAGFTQEQMISFGFSARHWQQVEAGRPITTTTLLRICNVFKTRLEDILGGLEDTYLD